VLAAAALAVGCGGGAPTPATPTTPPAPSPGVSASKLVVLDSGNFDALVLAAPRPSLVKFQSPT